MQHRAVTWCTEIAGTRAHRSLDGAQPLSLFTTVELPALLPLPAAPFELARWLAPKVAPDSHLLTELPGPFGHVSEGEARRGA